METIKGQKSMIRITHITSFENEELQVFGAYNEPQLAHIFEPEPGLFIAETPMIIERAFDAGYRPVAMLVEEGYAGRAVELLEKAGYGTAGNRQEEADDEEAAGNRPGKINTDKCSEPIAIYTAAEELLTRLTGYRLTRGMLCAMRRKELPDAEEILGCYPVRRKICNPEAEPQGGEIRDPETEAESGEIRDPAMKPGCGLGRNGCRRIAVLEDVMNPTNVGAIFRSAAALNIDAVLLTGGSSNPLYRRAARVAMGTCFVLPWTYIEEDYIGRLHELGFKCAAMALRDDCLAVDAPQLKDEQKLAIILGTEGEGLRKETIAACDYVVKIPMSHGVDSLNVAAASAVAFWELTK